MALPAPRSAAVQIKRPPPPEFTPAASTAQLPAASGPASPVAFKSVGGAGVSASPAPGAKRGEQIIGEGYGFNLIGRNDAEAV